MWGNAVEKWRTGVADDDLDDLFLSRSEVMDKFSHVCHFGKGLLREELHQAEVNIDDIRFTINTKRTSSQIRKALHYEPSQFVPRFSKTKLVFHSSR